MAKKMNIGIFHYQVGRTDGVSLEIEKWQNVLEELGHRTYLCAGDLGSAEGTLIKEMYHHLPEIERMNFNAFISLSDFNKDEYRDELFRWVQILERKFSAFIIENKIDFLIPQNVWSVAANIAVGVSLERVRRKFNLPALAHNHDFYWERNDISLTCPTVIEMIDKYFPPRDPKIEHVVINSMAQKQLFDRKGIFSTIVPNVFDFDPPYWHRDEYNSEFRDRIGLKENDLLILQATRIVPRKGIELAIEFVKALNAPQRREFLKKHGLYNGKEFSSDSRIVLVLTGFDQDDRTRTYLKNLKLKAKQSGVDMIHIADVVEHQREIKDGKKIFSLWDTYVFADFVTYPSLWEGWGNQFLEAIRAKLPIMVFEYPVFIRDIKPKGFDVVSLGSEIVNLNSLGLVEIPMSRIQRAADEAVVMLVNMEKRKKAVEHNFGLGREFYSFNALRQYFENLI